MNLRHLDILRASLALRPVERHFLLKRLQPV